MNEKELCIALGITRKLMKELRSSFEEFKHWQRIPSRKPERLWEIEWTLEGVSLLKNQLGLKKEEQIEHPKIITGKVYAKFNNKHIIQVMVDGKKENVICKDNSKFIPNMEVKIRWDGFRWCVIRHPKYQGKY